jgi:uncharacterized membrane protein YbhN (UPF0104 family)
VSTALLVGMLSPLPGGIGVTEGILATLAGFVGMNVMEIVSISLFFRTMSLVFIGTIVAVLHYLWMKSSFKKDIALEGYGKKK